MCLFTTDQDQTAHITVDGRNQRPLVIKVLMDINQTPWKVSRLVQVNESLTVVSNIFYNPCCVYSYVFLDYVGCMNLSVVDSQRASRNSLEASSPTERSPSPQDIELNRASISSCPDMAGLRVRLQKHYCSMFCESFWLRKSLLMRQLIWSFLSSKEEKENKKTSTKGKLWI